MIWLILVLAGLLEVVWATGLKFTEGFTRPLPSLVTLLAMAGSFYLLSQAMRSWPLGSAYAIWVGIGVIGAAIAGVILFREPVSALKIISLLLIVAGIVGLKLS